MPKMLQRIVEAADRRHAGGVHAIAQTTIALAEMRDIGQWIVEADDKTRADADARLVEELLCCCRRQDQQVAVVAGGADCETPGETLTPGMLGLRHTQSSQDRGVLRAVRDSNP